MTLAQIQSLIHSEMGVALYFTSPGCGVCHVLKPKMKQMLQERFPLIHFIETEMGRQSEIAGQFTVFTAPALLIFLDGREYMRFVRNMGLAEVAEKLERPYRLLTA